MAKAAQKKPNSFSVMHKGKRLYGAPALAIAAKRAGLGKNRAKPASKPNHKPAAKKPNNKPGVSVMHKGKRVYGVVAQNILAKRAARAKGKNAATRSRVHSQEVSGYFRKPPEGKTTKPGSRSSFPTSHKPKPGKNAKVSPYSQAGQRLFNRLFDFGINPGGAAKAIEDFKEFQGRSPEEVLDLEFPDGTPKNTSGCGPIPVIEMIDGRILKFNESYGDLPFLARRGDKLYIAPGDFRWSQPDPIGLVKRIHYITHKDHQYDGELIQFHHLFGEEGGYPPMLVADHELMLKLEGGSYHIDGDGIRD